MDPLDRVEHLERQVARIEAELGALRSRMDHRDGTAAPGDEGWAPPIVEPGREAPPEWPGPQVAPVTATRPTFAIDSETALKWAGVGLVVLAVGFAVSTAISRNWIGPELQLLGALVVGFGLIGLGLRLRERRPGWTHALCSGGVLALFTTVASDLFVDQTSIQIAATATVAIGLAGVLLARTVRSEWVAAATLVGGSIGWAVIVRDDPPAISGTIWFTLLVATSIALAVEREWFAVRLAAHVTGMIAALAIIDEVHGDADRLVLVTAAALLAASLCWIPGRGPLTSVWQKLEIQLTMLTAPWAFSFAVAIADTERDAAIGWTAITVAAGAAAVAVTLRTRLQAAHFASLLVGASITLSIGFAVLLGTTATFVALAVQGAGLIVLSRALGNDVRVLVNGIVVLTISLLYVAVAMLEAWSDDASFADDIGHALVVATLAAASWQFDHRVARRIGAVATLTLTLTWLGSVLVHLPQGQAAVSISWAVIGTAVFVTGAVRGDAQVGMVGLAVLGITVGKLLTVDLREVDALWRAGLFFLVGVGLLRLGFMLPRLGAESADEAEPGRPVDADPNASTADTH